MIAVLEGAPRFGLFSRRVCHIRRLGDAAPSTRVASDSSMSMGKMRGLMRVIVSRRLPPPRRLASLPPAAAGASPSASICNARHWPASVYS